MRKNKKIVSYLLMTAMLTVATTTAIQAKTTIPVKKAGTKVITVGDTVQLKKKQYKKVTYRWTSSNQIVATVNKKGIVTAQNEGTAIIRCYINAPTKQYIAKYTIKVNTEKKIVSQAQLTKALKNDQLTSISIDTKKKVVFTIPKGTYKDVSLSVNAPNADVINNGTFKAIKILSIKPNTWHEQAKGNRITVRAEKARIVVEQGASVDAMSFTKKDASVAVEVNGTVEQLKVTQANDMNIKANGTIQTVNVSAPSKMKLEANGTVASVAMNAPAQLQVNGTTKEGITVVASKKAEGAKVNANVKVAVQAQVAMNVALEKGAEGSSIEVADDTVKVTVKNETSEKVTVQSPQGNQEVGANSDFTSGENQTNSGNTNQDNTNGNTNTGNNTGSSNDTSVSNPSTPDNNQGTGSDTTKPEETPSIAEQLGLQIESVESVSNGNVRFTLNKPYKDLKQEMLSIICTTGGSDMTILSMTPSDDYKTFDLTTAYYDDNGYSLAIVFSDNSLIQKDFVSKYDCPEITSVRTTRTSDTEATVSYVSDEPGNFYYIVKDNAMQRLATRATHTVPNTLDGITEAYMLEHGTKVAMNQKVNEVKLSGLNKGQSYTVYYMAQSQDGKTTLIKKVVVDSEVVQQDSSNIQITSADGFYKYVSFFGENYRYEITLSEPTKTELTVQNFKISCPKDGNMSLGRVVTADNQHYTIYMQSGSIPQGNNEFVVTITFEDGTTAQKTFYVDFDAPQIATTSSKVERTGEQQLKVTLKSDEVGSIYWTILQPSDEFDPSSTARKDPKLVLAANPKEQAIVWGEGSFTVDTDEIPEGSYFCYVTKDERGNQSEYMYYMKIPTYVAPGEPDAGQEEQKTFEIEKVEVSEGFPSGVYDFYFTLKENIDLNKAGAIVEIHGPINKTMTVGDKYITTYPSGRQYLINIGSTFPKGDYTITITLPDGSVGTGSFTI